MLPSSYAAILERLDQIDPRHYAKTRNFLDGAVTGLGPYITHGAIGTCDVLEYLLEMYSFKEAEKLIFELAWRDFFQAVYRYHGQAIFSDLLQAQSPVHSRHLPQVVLEAQTGIRVLDRAITKLYETAYVHNHERMWLASVICNLARVGWQEPARWLYYHLLDGDLASNTLSWQWVAGSFSSKKYYANQENLNRYSKTEQWGTFLDRSYSDLARLSVPEVFQQAKALELQPPQLPQSEMDKLPCDKPVLLYHLWMLDPCWHQHDDATRVLVLEPSYLRTYPMSQKRLEFALALSKNIANLKLFVGELSELKNLDACPTITTIDHPSLSHWSLPKLSKETPKSMFAPSLKNYPSFFSYWKACQKTLRFRELHGPR